MSQTIRTPARVVKAAKKKARRGTLNRGNKVAANIARIEEHASCRK